MDWNNITIKNITCLSKSLGSCLLTLKNSKFVNFDYLSTYDISSNLYDGIFYGVDNNYILIVNSSFVNSSGKFSKGIFFL
jgi:hypothetical protein